MSTSGQGSGNKAQGYVGSEEPKKEDPKPNGAPEERKFSWWRALVSEPYKLDWKEYEREVADYAQQQEVLAKQPGEDRAEYSLSLGQGIRKMGGVKGCATFINIKGGVGVTPVACYSASAVGEYSKRRTAILDQNQDGGTADIQLGLEGSPGLTIRQVAKLFKEGKLNTATDFETEIPVTDHHVFLVKSDQHYAKEDYYTDETSEINLEMTRRYMPLIFNDTGQGLHTSAFAGILKYTDVPVFVTRSDDASIRGYKNSIRNLKEWGYGELMEHAIFVLTGIRPGEYLEDYREVLGLRNDQILLGVPYDEVIDMRKPVNLFEIELELLIAAQEIGLAILYRLQAKSNAELAEALKSLRSGQLVQIPSGRTPVLPWLQAAQAA